MATMLRPVISIGLLGLVTLGLLPAAVDAHDFPVRGSGTYGNGLAFSLQATRSPANTSGHVAFETNSFGDPEGTVDCLFTKERRAALSGTIDNPTSDLTHFLIFAWDKGEPKRHRRPKDEPAVWLRNGPFDCAAEFDGDLAQSPQRIQKGDVTVD
jgi:hypothetical protein